MAQAPSVDIREVDFSRGHHGKRSLRLNLFSASDGSVVSVPAGVISGRGGGPTIAVVAGQHGDEWNGVYVCHRLFEVCQYGDMIGTLVLLPVANPLAFDQRTRVSSIDHVDMDRSYGTRSEGHFTERISRLLMERLFLRCDFVVDLHSGGAGAYMANVGVTNRSRLAEAAVLGLPFAVVLEAEHRSLAGALERQSVPALTVQLGTSLHVDEERGELLVGGLVNLLRHLGCMKGSPEDREPPFVFSGKQVVTAPNAGFFKPFVSLGTEVERDLGLGEVTPLFAKDKSPIVAPARGVIMYALGGRMVAEGDDVFHIGLP